MQKYFYNVYLIVFTYSDAGKPAGHDYMEDDDIPSNDYAVGNK